MLVVDVVEQSFCGQSDLQARTQFSLWALFPAPLLISQNMLRWSAFALETYSNEEVYASATPSPLWQFAQVTSK